MKNRANFRLIKNLDWQNPTSADKGIVKIHYILEQGSLEEMKRLKEYQNALISFNWKYYQELALQREKNKDKIFDSLKSSSTSNYQLPKIKIRHFKKV